MQKLKSAQQMPGHFGVPILSDLRLIASEGYSLAEGLRRYGSVFKINLVMQKCAVLIGPDASRLMLQEQADRLSSYLGRRLLVEHIFGRPMVMQDGQEHRQTRRLIAPAFHNAVLARYFETLETIAQASLKDWATRGEIHLNKELLKMSLLVGIRLLLGVHVQQEIDKIEEWYNKLIKGALVLLRLNLPSTTYGQALRSRQKLKNRLQEMIAQRRQQGNLHASQDLLGLFLAAVDEDVNPLPETQISDELISLMSAAHFTTANVLSWAMFELAAHPEWRNRLQEELNQVVGDESLNVGHLRQLTQMTYFLKEIERLYPPIPILVRGVVEEVEYAGYRIPPGWSVIIPLFLTHRLPEIYANPEQFDPDRFAPPREEDKKMPFSLLGFGGGIHICIGREFALMEIKIFLAHLLRQYNWTITPDYSNLVPVLIPPKAVEKLRARTTPKIGDKS